MRYLAIGSVFFLLIAACESKAESAPQASARTNPESERSAPAAVVAPKSVVASTPPVAAKPVFVRAPEGDATTAVRSASDSAPDPQRVLVYVGAEWCEPCTRFHRAVEAGTLDEELAGVVFLEFDSDQDSARLAAAGYDGKLIPRFVRPADDGSPSQRRIEGGIKGDGAVKHIMGRLTALLAPAA